MQRHGCIVTFAPEPDEGSFYPLLEEAIERCDVFVAVAGAGYDGSSWLAHEVTYANQLARWRMGRRVPRLCGLRINEFALPPYLQSLPVEWLEPGQYGLLLEDLLPDTP